MADSSAHPSITPAQGWWAVYRRSDQTTYRVRVPVWVTEHVDTANSDYMAVRRALNAGANIPADAAADSSIPLKTLITGGEA
mgnify:CR=1 FL=1